MSTSLSNIGKSDGAQRYTTTAIINCSSYPASTTVPAAADATTTTTTTSATVATSSATVATSSATVATSSATAGKSALNKWTVSVPAVSSSSPSTGIVVAENVGSSSALDRWKPRELLLSSPSSAVQDTNPTTLFGRNDLKSVNGTGSGSSKISVAAMGTSVNRSNKESSIKIKNGGATTNGFSNGVSGGFGGNATGKLPVPPPAPPALVCTKNGFSVSCSGDFDGNGAGKGPTSSPAPPALDLANNGLSNGVSGSVNAAGKVPVPPPAPPALGFRSNDERLNNRRAMNRADTPGHSFKPPSFASTNSLPRGFNSKSINSYNTAPKPFTLSSGAMSKRLLPAKNGSSGGVLNQPTSVSESPSSANTTTMFTPAAAFSPATKNSPICSSSVLGGANPGNPKTLLARRASESAASGGSSDPSASSAKPKVDSNDPQVRKLVYNMYRGLLDQKHDQSNTIINSLPQLQVDRDEGVKNRVISMMKQQEDLKAGKQTNMNGPAGPPPPPPPPPFLVPGMTPPVMPEPAPAAPSAVGGRPSPRGPPIPMVAPPAALAGAMMKDRKPFTYTPGGLDLSEIRSPRMQRRLSRNAALEGVRPSPLAQQQSNSPTPSSPSPSLPSGLAVQVLPMPGMAMTKTATPSTPPLSKSKEPVAAKKSVCGPPPPPPPFVVGLDFSVDTQNKTNSVPGSILPGVTSSPPIQGGTTSDHLVTTPSSPPTSSSDSRSPSLSLASTSTNCSSANNIPDPPPLPVLSASAAKNSFNGYSTSPVAAAAAPVTQQLIESDLQKASGGSPCYGSPNSFAGSEPSRSRESSSMAVEDSSTSFREDSVTPSVASNVDRSYTKGDLCGSNESILKQISALANITTKHLSNQEVINTSYPKVSQQEYEQQRQREFECQKKQEERERQFQEEMRQSQLKEKEERLRDEERRQKQFEEERQRRLDEEERQKNLEEEERQRKLGEEEELQRQLEEEEQRQRQLEEEVERQRQLEVKEKERQKQLEEKERQRLFEEEAERQREFEEAERQRQFEEAERQRQLEEEAERQRQFKEEADRKKQLEEENQRQRQIEEERLRRLEEQKRQIKLKEEERKRQLEEERLRRQQEDERRQQQQLQRRQEQERKQEYLLQMQSQQTREQERLQQDQQSQQYQHQDEHISPPVKGNCLSRQSSVPLQSTQPNRHSDASDQTARYTRSSSASRSPNVSPTSGLMRAPLPWMSAIPRRETSAPPEFVNYAQGAHFRLQQQQLQRAQRQQSQEQGRTPSAPSPVFKEAIVLSPPVVYQHPGSNECGALDIGRNTLPRHSKLNSERGASAPAQRPWVAKHQQYQQQKIQQQQQHHRGFQKQHSLEYVQEPPQQQQWQSQQPAVGQRWPQVQPPSFIRQQSYSHESNQNNKQVNSSSISKPRVRIIPIMVEQDSSSDAEQRRESVTCPMSRDVPISSACSSSYQPATPYQHTNSPYQPVNSSYESVRSTYEPVTARYQPDSSACQPGNVSYKPLDGNSVSAASHTSLNMSPMPNPPAPWWEQEQGVSCQPTQASRLPGRSATDVNYINNSNELYSDSNAVEALQQMQQSLAQLNSGLQNAYPKFIQEKISHNLPTRSLTSPGPILPQASDPLNPTQSRSFRLLQTVVDGEASGSDDEIRGFLHPQDGNSQSAEEKTCSGGSSYSKGRNNSLILSPLAYDNHHHQQQQQHQQQLSQQQQSPSKFQNKYLFDEDDIQRGSSLEPKTSKFFRRLQTITDTLPAGVEPQGPVHIGKIKPKQQPARQQGTPATGIAPSSSIPSRSFRTLQQYTDAQHDDAAVVRPIASPPQPMSTSSSSPSSSLSCPSAASSSSSSSAVSFTSPNTNNKNDELRPGQNGRVFGGYSQPASASVYRSVQPQIVISSTGDSSVGLKQRNVVNSALNRHRDASPARHWYVNTNSTSRSESPINGKQNLISADQSRLLKFISQEAADNANKNTVDAIEQKKLYGGAKIPSRVFKQLQTEYSDSSDVPDSKSPTPNEAVSSRVDKPQLSAGLLRLLQSDYNKLQNDGSSSDIENNSVISSSYGEMDEYYKRGMMNTAVAKESVLKELTTQFDPVTQRRKPRAAPGRVFRYLQQQFDDPEPTNTGTGHSNGCRNANLTYDTKTQQMQFHSPSFNFFQSQYKEDSADSCQNACKFNVPYSDTNEGSKVNSFDRHDLSSLRITEEGDPVISKPYVGNRIPGRTFKLLQENYNTHPSVLQARK